MSGRNRTTSPAPSTPSLAHVPSRVGHQGSFGNIKNLNFSRTGRGATYGPAHRPGSGGAGECHSSAWCLVFKGKHQAEGAIMRVFVTGATGPLGRHLVPGLLAG